MNENCLFVKAFERELPSFSFCGFVRKLSSGQFCHLDEEPAFPVNTKKRFYTYLLSVSGHGLFWRLLKKLLLCEKGLFFVQKYQFVSFFLIPN